MSTAQQSETTAGPPDDVDLTWLPDLASRALGGGVVTANDEFFAAADNLLNPFPPTFAPQTFGAKGQVYDGWETRRRRQPGSDHVIIRLGVPGVVRAVLIDTAFFTGNYPPYAQVDGADLGGHPGPEQLAEARWTPLVPRTALAGDARVVVPVDVPGRQTHVRLTIFPDGGVARLRVHGEPVPDPRLLTEVLDLAAVEHGGRIEACSDRFYGSPQHLLLPGPARVMGEGWETARRRDDGNDWVRVKLCAAGVIDLVELDTSHFKGNAPAAARLIGVDATTDDPADPARWRDLLPVTELRPDTRHRFRLDRPSTVTHVRLDVYPDGGMARLRLFGRLTEAGAADLADRFRRTTNPA
ncbi:allantoicase [Solwaraspora sp. WMMD406]|uniref:allantoicase n=1 Tax=Solwaraspora sp. WMMD406 TaxID=3016095 RepID=UPI002416B94E|nr:allantoicase [Solwaraspora sp. WMMD406]MDG4765978.1 allantoicase [Solwaraspora sp. WMMD406]